MSALYWYITDFWELYYAIPVSVKQTEASGGIVVARSLGDGVVHEYKIESLAELYTNKAQAELDAAHMNALAINRRDEYG